MMEEHGLVITCKLCKKGIKEPGALIFSPPDSDDILKKYHICVGCWPSVLRFIKDGNPTKTRTNK